MPSKEPAWLLALTSCLSSGRLGESLESAMSLSPAPHGATPPRRTRADLITLITEAQAEAEEAKAQRESITPLLSAIAAMCVVALVLGFYLGGK